MSAVANPKGWVHPACRGMTYVDGPKTQAAEKVFHEEMLIGFRMSKARRDGKKMFPGIIRISEGKKYYEN